MGFALRGLRGSGTAKRRISSQVRWLSVARTSTWRTPSDDKIFAVSGYDVIGDIHGQADKLVGLLRHLGYNERQGAWRHSERTAVFVGDLIDRGPKQLDSIRIPRAMVEAGTARIVLGNHEFNALAYSHWDDARSGFCRSRSGASSEKHREQHQAFIEQVGLDTPQSREVLDWLGTIPIWLDLGGLRVVHACWDVPSIEHLSGTDDRQGERCASVCVK